MRSAIAICLALAILESAEAVTFLDTADPLHNTTTPGDNSGWQFEGKFYEYLGVPIGPFHFITANHFGGTTGGKLNFHGELYTTIGFQIIPTGVPPAMPGDPVPLTDLRVWEVDHSKPFPIYAPLSSGLIDIGATATVIGRGKQRGAEVFLGAVLKGWNSGTVDQVQRWGRNVVTAEYVDPDVGKLLLCDFNNPGIADECHLSIGDSGGGLWVLENGLWRLAGIHYAVDGNFRVPPSGGTGMRDAAIFDAGGLEVGVSPIWTLITDTVNDIPASFYSSRISTYLTAIQAVTGGDGSLPPESYRAWQTLYFTPAEIANPGITGPLGDYDSDGIANVLEFALNSEPGFNARTAMTPATGLSGLPFVKVESISGADHLTMEFVRRTAGSGSGLTYLPQFSSDAEDWQAVGTETFTAINPRWERVKIVDPQTTATDTKRFARLKVVVGS